MSRSMPVTRTVVVGLAGGLVLSACGAGTVDVDGANAAVGEPTSRVTCPAESDTIVWGDDEALRLLVLGAGTDHRNEAEAAARAWGEGVGADVATAGLALYGSPVPARAIAGRLGGDPPPDVVEGFVGGMLHGCAQQGRLADLTELWDAEGWDAVFPRSIIELATVDGRRHFVPTTMQWNPIWYRPDVFADLGLEPPEDWDDLLAACDTLADAGITPLSLGTATWAPPVARWFSHINLGLHGPDFHQRLLAGRESWTGPRVEAVFDHWQQLLDRDCFGDEVGATSYQAMIDAVVEGDAGMLDLGSWIHESLEPEQSARLAPIPFPTIDPEVPRTHIATVQGVFVPSSTERPDQSRALAAALASPDRLQDSFDQLGRTVVRTDLDPGHGDAHRQERTAIAEADRVVQLLEFSTEQRHASSILATLAGFVGDPTSRDVLLERLEQVRVDVYEES